jgi:adenylylsulfate kinase
VFSEMKRRSFVKMLSWRIFATVITMILVYIFVGKIEIAVAVGILEVIAKMALYFFHERIWNKVSYGRKEIIPFVLWFTGLPCSGKSTLADKAYEYLKAKGVRVERLDGDTVRDVFPQTGFTKEARDEHIGRIGYLTSMLEKNGVIVVASFVSPYIESRNYVRGLCNKFIEIYVDTPVEICEERDVKGMYRLAREGKIKNFTGINDPYEVPVNAELVVDAGGKSIDEAFEQIMGYVGDLM